MPVNPEIGLADVAVSVGAAERTRSHRNAGNEDADGEQDGSTTVVEESRKQDGSATVLREPCGSKRSDQRPQPWRKRRRKPAHECSGRQHDPKWRDEGRDSCGCREN